MERKVSFLEAKNVLGNNFIGPTEIEKLRLGFTIPSLVEVPNISFSIEELREKANTHILFLGIPHLNSKLLVNIKNLKNIFGENPELNLPCFYFQDWYENQDFIKECIDLKWFFIPKELNKNTKGKSPESLMRQSVNFQKLNSAIEIIYLFFVYYLHTKGEVLFEGDYIWTRNLDNNGDIIYVGNYQDSFHQKRIGFEIHRHLSIKSNYGALI